MSTSPTASTTAHVPVSAEDRLEHIDLVRGYALLGVLLVNLHSWFRTPPQRYFLGRHPYPDAWNMAADYLTSIWFEGKSVTLFSMLFAVGLCIQRERALQKGVPWNEYALRRLGSMLLFGVLHIVLIWNGDILHNYALVGFPFLLFLGRERRTIGIWLSVIFGLAAAGLFGYWVWLLFHQPPTPPTQDKLKEALDWGDACVRGYTQTSWFQVLVFRVRDFKRMFLNIGNLGVFSFFTLVNFLIGLYLWKQGAIRAPRDHLPLLRRVAGWGLGLGLLANVLNAMRPMLRPIFHAHWSWSRFFMLPLMLSEPVAYQAMALGLGAALIVLWQDPTWKRRLRPITYVGRMAFTNYITQSIVCTTIFYGFGLGLYDKLGPLAGTGIVAAIYGLQIPFSRFWLSRFRYGPLEWLWRTLTYGSLQPFRRTAPVRVAVENLAP
ncbi:MAG TPA: DUF418 domain-containing protein [Polyangia bacterium]|nr:DUF418 domain-containing protein [Polyangia bacterium]